MPRTIETKAAWPGRPFELTGGSLCLDLANTVDNRPSPRRTDLLPSYARLVEWGRQSGILTSLQARRLLRASLRRPRKAAGALAQAKSLREALYGIFSALAAKRIPPEAEMATLNRALRESTEKLRLAPQGGGFAWQWAGGEQALDQVLWPVARSAAELLTSEERAKVRGCASDICGWLFVDRSRNGLRRWCDMKVCGNRNKVRRFYARHRQDRMARSRRD